MLWSLPAIVHRCCFSFSGRSASLPAVSLGSALSLFFRCRSVSALVATPSVKDAVSKCENGFLFTSLVVPVVGWGGWG